MGCNSHDFYDRIMKQQTLIQSMIVTDITWTGFTDSIDVQLTVTIHSFRAKNVACMKFI